jgi:hypothetical protein
LIFVYQTTVGCDSILEIHIVIEKTPEPDSLELSEIALYWHRVLAVTNPHNLDVLRFAQYRWYKNGVRLPQSNRDWIEPDFGNTISPGRYSVSVISGEFEILYLERIVDEQQSRVTAYPNPLNMLQELTIQTDSEIRYLEIFDMGGVQHKLPIYKSAKSAVVKDFKKNGVYIFRIHLEDNTIQTLIILVK